MRYLFLVGLSLLAFEAGAATGSAAADTFYVRPSADCVNNGDGMAYACAASAGASGAWRTSAAVSYSTTTGVDDGDTLKFCGNFVEADLDTGAYFIFLASTVTAANEAGRITITGDCSADGGPSTATVTGGATMTIGFAMSVSDYITLQNFEFRDINQVVGNTCSPASDPDAPIFRNITGRGITNAGAAMSFNGVGYLADNIDIETAGEPIFICNGTTNVSAGTVRNARLVTTSTTDENADGIQQESGGGSITLENVSVYKSNPFKGCGLVGSALGAVKVDGFYCYYTGTSAAITGLAVDGSAAGGYVRNLWSNAPGSALLLRDDVTAFAGTFDVSTMICAGVERCISLDGAHPAGAFTFYQVSGWATGEWLYAVASFNPLSAVFRNMYVDAPTALDINASVAAADIDIDYTRYGPTVANWSWRGTTDTTFAAYQVTSSKDANSAVADPAFLGGTNPTSADGFKLKPDSTLCRAGTYVGKLKDYWGRSVDILDPSIGAMDCNAEYRTDILTRE